MSDEIGTLKEIVANQAAVITNLNVQVSNLNSIVANLSLNIQNLTEKMCKYYTIINEQENRISEIETVDSGVVDMINNVQAQIDRLVQLIDIGY